MSKEMVNTQTENSKAVTDEERRALKTILKGLPDLINYCRYFESRRKSLFDMAQIQAGTLTFFNMEKVIELLALPLSTDDKRSLYAYFDASTKIKMVELGVEVLKEGLYRDIVYDRYFRGMSYKELVEKYGVNHKYVQRVVQKSYDYFAEYYRWYLKLAEKIQMSLFE